ncbi:hypothetical protein WJX72_003476 [[Myrmecia] bisecta]|uniref:CipC-like antibiotic response protein n=1 Tax=[Myrmecia] bisecta TaxID=41462 RepID=A0AAW1Q2B1_9CHLO
MVFGWGEHEQAHDELYGDKEHDGCWTHEALAGGAAFYAMRQYEQKREREGVSGDHAFLKEMLAAAAGAEVDKLVETKGLDYIDREKAKRHAEQQAFAMYDQRYGGGGQGYGGDFGYGGDAYGREQGYGGGGGYDGRQEGYGEGRREERHEERREERREEYGRGGEYGYN